MNSGSFDRREAAARTTGGRPQRQTSTGERFGKMAYQVGKDRRSHSER